MAVRSYEYTIRLLGNVTQKVMTMNTNRRTLSLHHGQRILFLFFLALVGNYVQSHISNKLAVLAAYLSTSQLNENCEHPRRETASRLSTYMFQQWL
jgi:hypothetical protein